MQLPSMMHNSIIATFHYNQHGRFIAENNIREARVIGSLMSSRFVFRSPSLKKSKDEKKTGESRSLVISKRFHCIFNSIINLDVLGDTRDIQHVAYLGGGTCHLEMPAIVL